MLTLQDAATVVYFINFTRAVGLTQLNRTINRFRKNSRLKLSSGVHDELVRHERVLTSLSIATPRGGPYNPPTSTVFVHFLSTMILPLIMLHELQRIP